MNNILMPGLKHIGGFVCCHPVAVLLICTVVGAIHDTKHMAEQYRAMEALAKRLKAEEDNC